MRRDAENPNRMAEDLCRCWITTMAPFCGRWSRKRTIEPWRNMLKPSPHGPATRSASRVFAAPCSAQGLVIKKDFARQRATKAGGERGARDVSPGDAGR